MCEVSRHQQKKHACTHAHTHAHTHTHAHAHTHTHAHAHTHTDTHTDTHRHTQTHTDTHTHTHTHTHTQTHTEPPGATLGLPALCHHLLSGTQPPGATLQLSPPLLCDCIFYVMCKQKQCHRSHFGSRYKLGCCGHAGLVIFSCHFLVSPHSVAP